MVVNVLNEIFMKMLIVQNKECNYLINDVHLDIINNVTVTYLLMYSTISCNN